MLDGPNIARIASLIGDPARANMLCALMDGRALTATELASQGGVSKQTASSHLSNMERSGLLACEAQGRHRYFRLANADVATAIEALMGVAQRQSGQRVRTGPSEPALRRARICYDHLAGDVAVAMYDRLLSGGAVVVGDEDRTLILTDKGRDLFRRAGLDIDQVDQARRPTCRSCLDWSARRHHLAGGLGAAIFQLAKDKGWVRRVPENRAVHLLGEAEAHLLSLCTP